MLSSCRLPSKAQSGRWGDPVAVMSRRMPKIACSTGFPEMLAQHRSDSGMYKKFDWIAVYIGTHA